jgi:hypothetical protein
MSLVTKVCLIGGSGVIGSGLLNDHNSKHGSEVPSSRTQGVALVRWILAFHMDCGRIYTESCTETYAEHFSASFQSGIDTGS